MAHNAVRPSNIPETTPLQRRPPTGIKVAYLNCSLSACTPTSTQFMEAAKALGWDGTVVTYSAATPGTAVQQAIDSGNQYIVLDSLPADEIGPQLAAAKAKHIPIISEYSLDSPNSAVNDIYATVEGPRANIILGTQAAEWMIANSNGHAHAVFVTLPIIPALAGLQSGAESEFKSQCPGCSLFALNLSESQLAAGQGPSTLVSYLETHTNINYVYTAFSNLYAGVVPALKAAGLSSRVKIIGDGGTTPELEGMVQGNTSAIVASAQAWVQWAALDLVARLVERQPITQRQQAIAENGLAYIVDGVSGARALLAPPQNGDWPGPPNYIKQFESLWHVK